MINTELFYKRQLGIAFCKLKGKAVTHGRVINFSQKMNPKSRVVFNTVEKKLLPDLQAAVREDVRANGYESVFINKFQYVSKFIHPAFPERKIMPLYQAVNKHSGDFRKEFKFANAEILRELKNGWS